MDWTVITERMVLLTTSLRKAIKNKERFSMSEDDMIICMHFIPNGHKEDIIHFWYLCTLGLDDKSKKILEEFCTPYLVNSVYFSNRQ